MRRHRGGTGEVPGRQGRHLGGTWEAGGTGRHHEVPYISSLFQRLSGHWTKAPSMVSLLIKQVSLSPLLSLYPGTNCLTHEIRESGTPYAVDQHL